MIIDGDDSSTPVADTNIWLMPNKGEFSFSQDRA